MAWLRIDDDFATHPKILGLTDRQHRTWINTLCYCARYRTQGQIPATAMHQLGLDTRTLARYLELQLLDRQEGSLTIHDWNDYNRDPTNQQRQERYRARAAERNGGDE